MTNEEAIKYLNDLYVKVDLTDEYGDCIDTTPYDEALNLAIKALETVDQAHNSLLNEEESDRLLAFIGDDTGLHERAVSDLNDTVADVLRKCKRGDV